MCPYGSHFLWCLQLPKYRLFKETTWETFKVFLCLLAPYAILWHCQFVKYDLLFVTRFCFSMYHIYIKITLLPANVSMCVLERITRIPEDKSNLHRLLTYIAGSRFSHATSHPADRDWRDDLYIYSRSSGSGQIALNYKFLICLCSWFFQLVMCERPYILNWYQKMHYVCSVLIKIWYSFVTIIERDRSNGPFYLALIQ